MAGPKSVLEAIRFVKKKVHISEPEIAEDNNRKLQVRITTQQILVRKFERVNRSSSGKVCV